jgi:DNA topoisomerase VI subunit B
VDAVTRQPVVARETFATPRAAEFLDLRHLQAQTGQPASRFAEVIVKELADNALDAAETAGMPPEVTIATAERDGHLEITVADNGPGMPPELVARVLDFSVLVSDKAAYRSPARGAQGNALKTVIGIPGAFRSAAPVVVTARGVRHAIAAAIDPAGELRIDHQQSPAPERPGTTVTVTVPADLDVDAARWARAFALVNPHAAIAYRANGADPADAVSYKPTAPDGWRKPLPTDPTSAHWYDPPALERLVFAHIGAARRGGRDLPLGEFVRTFAGLSSTAKAKAVCAQLPAVRRLSDFEADPPAVAVLLVAMQAASRAPKPAALGRVDEDHYRACFEAWYGAPRFWFKRAKTAAGAIPWVVEIAVAETAGPGELFYAVNYSPTFGDPLARLPLDAGELRTVGAGAFLRQVDAYPDGRANRAAAIHVINPAAHFLDKGKTSLVVPE